MARRGQIWIAAAALVLTGAIGAAAKQAPKDTPKSGSGWTLPEDASTEKNPVAGDASAVQAGRQLFNSNCKRCHGPGGKGDGPDADPDNQQDMDLTNPARASKNPDGVVFYKVWNGRQKPKMPAFKDKLTKDQVWQIVSFVQTLRGAS
jgi:mono/diheme cytochrome c family protein